MFIWYELLSFWVLIVLSNLYAQDVSRIVSEIDVSFLRLDV